MSNPNLMALDMLKQLVRKIEDGDAMCSTFAATPEYEYTSGLSTMSGVRMADFASVTRQSIKFSFDIAVLNPDSPFTTTWYEDEAVGEILEQTGKEKKPKTSPLH